MRARSGARRLRSSCTSPREVSAHAQQQVDSWGRVGEPARGEGRCPSRRVVVGGAVQLCGPFFTHLPNNVKFSSIASLAGQRTADIESLIK